MAVKRTILVVEDEKDIRELIRFHLEQEAYAVREADSASTSTPTRYSSQAIRRASRCASSSC